MYQIRATAIPIPEGRGLPLSQRELYILPTRQGLWFALVLVVLLLAAVNFQNGLAYGLTFLLGAIALVSMLHTHRVLHRLRVVAGPCMPVHAGTTANFAALLVNDAARARLGLIMDQGRKRLIGRVDLPPGVTATVTLTRPTERRGYLAAPDLVINTRFPLGLWHAWSRRLHLATQCLVYPAPAPPGPLPFDTMGVHGARREGDDFAGLRAFRSGDAPQHVAWKTLARGQGWYTKQFGADPQATVWLDWDALPGHDTETRLSILCRWVLEASARDVPYGLRLPGISLPPRTGSVHRHECLKHLALFGG